MTLEALIPLRLLIHEPAFADSTVSIMSDKLIQINVVNLEGLSTSANLLIQKISDAIEGYAKPFQIRRVAKADAYVAKLQAATRIKTTDIERRAMKRLFAEEAQKQLNIEQITAKAFPYLKVDSKPQDVENDWIINFFDKCRLISDDQMQSLWAKILAGEANAPGRFSKRTVNFLTTLDKQDAELFATLCRFRWDLNGAKELLIVSDFTTGLRLNPVYTNNGISTDALQHLDDIGLASLLVNDISEFRLSDFPVTCEYHGKIFRLFQKDKPPVSTSIYLGRVHLTQVGKQIAELCDSKPVDGFYEYIFNRWKGWWKGWFKVETQS